MFVATVEAKFNKNLNASALAPNPGTKGTHTKSLTLIRWEHNSQNSAFSRKDYRIYLYYKFDLIFQPITPFVGLSSQCRNLGVGGAKR